MDKMFQGSTAELLRLDNLHFRRTPASVEVIDGASIYTTVFVAFEA